MSKIPQVKKSISKTKESQQKTRKILLEVPEKQDVDVQQLENQLLDAKRDQRSLLQYIENLQKWRREELENNEMLEHKCKQVITINKSLEKQLLEKDEMITQLMDQMDDMRQTMQNMRNKHKNKKKLLKEQAWDMQQTIQQKAESTKQSLNLQIQKLRHQFDEQKVINKQMQHDNNKLRKQKKLLDSDAESDDFEDLQSNLHSKLVQLKDDKIAQMEAEAYNSKKELDDMNVILDEQRCPICLTKMAVWRSKPCDHWMACNDCNAIEVMEKQPDGSRCVQCRSNINSLEKVMNGATQYVDIIYEEQPNN